MTNTLFDRIVRFRNDYSPGKSEALKLLAECQRRIEAQATEIKRDNKEIQEQADRIEELERSMVKHFNEEHLAGDGPEIQRWKNKLERAEALLRHYFQQALLRHYFQQIEKIEDEAGE